MEFVNIVINVKYINTNNNDCYLDPNPWRFTMILDCTVGMNFTSLYYLDMDLKTKTQFALTDYSNGEYNIVKKKYP